MGDDDEAERAEKRSAVRIDVDWSVDCEAEDTFLYASITNISAMGIFVRTMDALDIGTMVRLKFSPRDDERPFELRARVQWVNRVQTFGDNPNPGMGLQLIDLTADERERLVETIHTIAYLRSDPTPRPN